MSIVEWRLLFFGTAAGELVQTLMARKLLGRWKVALTNAKTEEKKFEFFSRQPAVNPLEGHETGGPARQAAGSSVQKKFEKKLVTPCKLQ
jgi:hypothetical protein